MSSNVQKFVLDNGVRVLVEPNHTVRSVSIGLTCATGSRHELEHEAGITHFIEHMLFKGTPTRNAKQIAGAIEGRGGVLNAFTDKEVTTYYCRMLRDDASIGVEVLSDMMLHSLLDSEELEREKGVVLEEISRSEDEPGDHVHDLHIQARWGDHPLGKPIIGTRESVSSFSRDDLATYIQRRYQGGNVILSVAGDVEADEVLALAKANLSSVPSGGGMVSVPTPTPATKNTEVKKDIEQVHFCIGTDSVGILHEDLYGMAVLDSILGGGMSSRLFQEVRERRGLAYAIGSYNLSYSSGGLFTVYGGTSLKTWEQVQEVVFAEFKKIIDNGLEEGELDQVKRQIAGNTVLALEGMSSRMLRMTRNEINHGRDVPVDETLAKINAVTESKVQELTERFCVPEKMGVTVIRPQ